MRAKPSAPATTPSCQSASPLARPISGSSGLNAPIEKQLQRLMKQSSAVLLKARTDRSVTVGFFPVWRGEYTWRAALWRCGRLPPNTLSIFGYRG